jgi:excisionase family DNA binding protein
MLKSTLSNKPQSVLEGSSNDYFPQIPFFSIQQVADYIGVCDKTLRKYLKNGSLPYFKLGSFIRIRRQDLLNFIEKNVRR